MQSFYKRKEGKMRFLNNKNPFTKLTKRILFSVKRQSKWLINDFGVAQYELKFDEEGLPILEKMVNIKLKLER